MKGCEKSISEYAKRMRELTGFSEGKQNKSIKTIQEGVSSFENGMTFMAKDLIKSNNDSENEFEIHKFEQKEIECTLNDEEIYNLDENTIIVFDFVNETLGHGEDLEQNEDEDDEYIDPTRKAHIDYEREKFEKKYNSDEWVDAQKELGDDEY